MVNNDKSAVLDKIKKLLTLADPNRGGTAEEVDTAMKMATQLMRKHNISEAEAYQKTAEISIGEGAVDAPTKLKKWQQELGLVFEYLCDVRCILYKSKGRPVRIKMCFIGTPKDLALASEMYTIFRKQIRRNAKHAYSQYIDQRSYCVGYTRQLIARAREIAKMRKAEEQADGCQALVFVGKKQSAIDQYMNSLNLKEAKIRSHKLANHAYAHGAMDGSQVDLGMDKRLK